MDNKSKNQPKTVAIQSTAKPNENAEMIALRKQVEELKKALESKPVSLEDKIKYYEEKEKQIKQLAKMDAYAKQLEHARTEIEEAKETDEFFTEEFSIRVVQKKGYSSENEIFKLHQPAIILDLVEHVMERMSKKREQLKTLIDA